MTEEVLSSTMVTVVLYVHLNYLISSLYHLYISDGKCSCIMWCLQNKLITVTPDTKVLKAMQLMTGRRYPIIDFLHDLIICDQCSLM